MPNGIDLILADHRAVEALFATFDATTDPTVVGQILDALTAHDDVEHSALYPLAGEVLGNASVVTALAAAHIAVKQQMEHLRQLEGAPLTAAVRGLRDMVARHVADEERKLLPLLADKATPLQLETLGSRILLGKQRVG
jgi:hemerythrin superfamily protein